MNDHKQKLRTLVTKFISGEPDPTESQLKEWVGMARMHVPQASDEDVAAVIDHFEKNFSIKIETGEALQVDFKPWYHEQRANLEKHYWPRYRQFLLRKERPRKVVNAIDDCTGRVMDLLGDPRDVNSGSRRGLVVGEVQSGKTGTYIGLMAKAADAGYRVIVLLTGTIEALRKQTQERVDEGLLGVDTSQNVDGMGRVGGQTAIGVGLEKEFDRTRRPISLTSASKNPPGDFTAVGKGHSTMHINTVTEPLVFVVKKNVRILDRLNEWIKDRVASEIRDLPILVIDDEADHASINTKNSGDPTAINKQIRSLLSSFRRNSYVGFTATPFANIFINPQSHDAMLGDDLFPRHFIFSLNSPENYFGVSRLFGGDGTHASVRRVDDVDTMVPKKHKSTDAVKDLSPSLIGAVDDFLIVNTIFDLRGCENRHRSMLVNVSQFVGIQRQLKEKLRDFLSDVSADLTATANSRFAPESAHIKRIQARFSSDWSKCGFDWIEVKARLSRSQSSIKVMMVNSDAEAESRSGELDYSLHSKEGLRVIAVGGNALSRGLTLENLMVSYFARYTVMYDTLMQMGRWFGYKGEYDDLFRIYMPQELIGRYSHVADVDEELRGDFTRMVEAGGTPNDFGLRVRCHEESVMIVTARNKSRDAEKVECEIAYGGKLIETALLPLDENARNRNVDAACSFVERIGGESSKKWEKVAERGFIVRELPAVWIAELLSKLRFPDLAKMAFFDEMQKILRTGEDANLHMWDVAIPSIARPNEKTESFKIGGSGLVVRCPKRTCDIHGKAIRVSTSKRRLGDQRSESLGLSVEQVRAADEKAAAGKKDVAGYYRSMRERPMLLMYFISPEVLVNGEREGAPVAFGLGLSFNGSALDRRTASYMLNIQALKERFGEYELEEGESDES